MHKKLSKLDDSSIIIKKPIKGTSGNLLFGYGIFSHDRSLRHENGLEGGLKFEDTEAREAHIERMTQHFHELVEAIYNNPENYKEKEGRGLIFSVNTGVKAMLASATHEELEEFTETSKLMLDQAQYTMSQKADVRHDQTRHGSRY